MTNRLAKSKAAAVIIAACVVTAGAAPAAGATTTTGSQAGSASAVTATEVTTPGLLRAPVGALFHNVLCGGCYEAT